MNKQEYIQIGSLKMIEWEGKTRKIELGDNNGTGKSDRSHVVL